MTCRGCKKRVLPGLPEAIILKTGLPPGDICTLTAAVYSLKHQYPQIKIAVRTNHPDLWLHNPDVEQVESGKLIEMEYDLIHKSNQVPVTFIHGYCAHLAKSLNLPLQLHTNRPMLYLAENEHRVFTPPKPYWLISRGIKNDFTLKAWPTEYYQAVIDALKDKITFVQIGHKADNHPELSGCLSLVGHTSLRDMIVLAHDCLGGLGPSTLLQHLCAAWQRPYICLLGGREGKPWQDCYQTQHTLHTIGTLDCCATGGCWKSKVQTDCKYPILDMQRPVGRCMKMIGPDEVIALIKRAIPIAAE